MLVLLSVGDLCPLCHNNNDKKKKENRSDPAHGRSERHLGRFTCQAKHRRRVWGGDAFGSEPPGADPVTLLRVEDGNSERRRGPMSVGKEVASASGSQGQGGEVGRGPVHPYAGRARSRPGPSRRRRVARSPTSPRPAPPRPLHPRLPVRAPSARPPPPPPADPRVRALPPARGP